MRVKLLSHARGTEQCGIRVDDEAGRDRLHEGGESAFRLEALAEGALHQIGLDLSRDAARNENSSASSVREGEVTGDRAEDGAKPRQHGTTDRVSL